MREKGKTNLQVFLLARILLVLVTVFVLVFLAVNIFLRIYIVRGAGEQLKDLIAGDEVLISKKEQLDEILKNGDSEVLQSDKGPLGIRGNAFICTADGVVMDILHGDEMAVEEIVAYFTDHPELELDMVRNLHIVGDIGTYYVSSKKDMLRENAWAVYYVDVTSVMQFFDAVLQALLVILLVSILIAVVSARWMAGQLTGKVKKLSDYAAQIGEGNYEVSQPEVSIRELDELSVAMGRMVSQIDEGQKQQIAFFQNVSHELRTPLMSIRCYAEGIEYGVMDPKQSSETNLEETDLLSGMVEDILYISRVDRNAGGGKREEVDLREILSACAASQRRLAKDIIFVFDFDETPVILTCNEEDMGRLCGNLISNAVRYANRRITLECKNKENEILIVVEDDGDGIREEDLAHIFERFYKGRGGIHGIGLSIVKSVADIYGGTARVRNADGARFEIVFPRER